MVLDFYHIPGSAACRAVQMVAKAVGVDLNLKHTNVFTGEHLKPEFLKMNPQHTVPTLIDDGFVLWESRAIMVYLVEKYGKTTSLYPSDPAARALVNQRLFFDDTLYRSFAEYYKPQIFHKKPANPDHLKKLEDAAGFLNAFLDGQTYAAGPNLTLADITLVATVSRMDIVGFDLSKYPNIVSWYVKCKATVPGYDIHEDGVAEYKKYLK